MREIVVFHVVLFGSMLCYLLLVSAPASKYLIQTRSSNRHAMCGIALDDKYIHTYIHT